MYLLSHKKNKVTQSGEDMWYCKCSSRCSIFIVSLKQQISFTNDNLPLKGKYGFARYVYFKYKFQLSFLIVLYSINIFDQLDNYFGWLQLRVTGGYFFIFSYLTWGIGVIFITVMHHLPSAPHILLIA